MPRVFQHLLLIVMLPLLATSCRGSAPAELQRYSGSEFREPVRAVDLDPAEDVVRVELVAAPLMVEFVPGVQTELWAYNGSFPGPLIEAVQGDRVIVEFTNNLPEETTIHWHGVRLSNENDGTHLTQQPVPPGGSFTYDFSVPDASLFWYHPHFNSAQQVYRGLYGALLVHGEDPVPDAREHVLILSDLVLEGGQLVLPWEDGDQQLENAMGYLGNTLLVNGQLEPEMELRTGGFERFRIVNASAARPFNISMPGHQLTMIGTDGGLLESPVDFSEVLLSSGERADLIVATDAAEGSIAALDNAAYRSMHAAAAPLLEQGRLLQFSYSGSVAGLDRNIPRQLAVIDMPAVDAGEHRFQFNSALDPMPADIFSGEVPQDAEIRFASFAINGMLFPDVVAHEARLGTTEAWVVANHTQMDHPFHVHGYRFLVESENGEGPAYRGWKDTVNIPGSPGGNVETRLIIPFEDNPGSWVYHCHILRHVQLGMMGELEVTP